MTTRNFILLNLFLFLFSDTSRAAATARWILTSKPDPSVGGFYQSYWQGLYKLKGIDIQLQNSTEPMSDLKMVSEGKADFAIVGSDDIFQYLDKENTSKFRAVFFTFSDSPLVIVAKSEKPFKGLRDMWLTYGESIEIKKSSSASFFLQKKYGLPKATIADSAGGVTAFLKQNNLSISGHLAKEPFLVQKGGQKINLFLLSREGYKSLSNIVVVNDAFAKANPLIVKKWIEATQEGWDRYLKNPKQINTRMYELNTEMDIETMNRSAKFISKLVRHYDGTKVGEISAYRWKESYLQLKELGLVKKEIDSSSLLIQ